MNININVRGFIPRPWKSKAGKQGYSGTFIILDMSTPPIMDTLKLDSEFTSEEEMGMAASLVGKPAIALVSGLKVGIDGQPHLVGKIQLAK